MQSYSLAHLTDAVLLHDLAALVAQDRITTASLLAHIAEVDARRLYVPEGYPSMHAYCVGELGLAEDAAYKRIQAARAARRFPALFPALAEGRLHLSAVSLLAPHLTPENSAELIEAATHKGKSEIEGLLAQRLLPLRPPAPVHSAAAPIEVQLAPGQVGGRFAPAGESEELPAATALEGPKAPAQPEVYLLHLTVPNATRNKLRHAQALLSHSVRSGDVAQVLDRALDALIEKLERRKLGATRRPRTEHAVRHQSGNRRHVPAQVRRAVWERDEGQCTFISRKGKRCAARRFLEFDHVVPVARGGRASVEGMRLRCRAHNQYEAERTFGTGFMSRKREEARRAATEARGAAAAASEARARAALEARARAALEARERTAHNMPRSMLEAADAKERATREQVRDVFAGLRNLGCRADEARRAATLAGDLQDVTLEDRMRAALTFLSGR